MFAIPVGKATGWDINWLIGISGVLMTITVFFGISALTVLSVIAVSGDCHSRQLFGLPARLQAWAGMSALRDVPPCTAD